MTSKLATFRCWLARHVRDFYEASAVTFWKIEACEWRKLYQEQRGGEAFDAIQLQLADARAEIQRLKSLIPNTDISSREAAPTKKETAI